MAPEQAFRQTDRLRRGPDRLPRDPAPRTAARKTTDAEQAGRQTADLPAPPRTGPPDRRSGRTSGTLADLQTTRTGCKSSGCRTGSQRLWSNKPRAGRTASAYHATGSFRITPSIASSAANVPARYCTQSITSGSSPLLRTERFPAGATRTTLPSATGKTVPST